MEEAFAAILKRVLEPMAQGIDRLPSHRYAELKALVALLFPVCP